MSNVIQDSFEAYRNNLRLVLLFSIPFVIVLAIPIFVTLPTYISAGGIFLRSASIFTNMNIESITIIVGSSLFSLLLISFAFALISLIVKSEKTTMRISLRALRGIEKYVARIFVVLLVYTLILLLVNIIGYYYNVETIATALFGFFGFMLIFYVPSAIVVDDRKIWRALKDGVRLVVHEPQYFFLWLILITLVVSILDVIAINLSGTVLSGYILLVVNSLFVLPYFVIFQAEAYMRRFPLLRH